MTIRRYWVSTGHLNDKASIVASDSVVYGADYDAVDRALAVAQSIIARQDADIVRLTKGLRSIMDSGCDYDIEIARRALRSNAQTCDRTLSGKHWWISQDDGTIKCQSCNSTPAQREAK